MSEHVSSELVCRRCRAALDADDNYCRRCGMPTANAPGPSGGGLATPIVASRGFVSRGGRPGWWENPWFIVVMLFVVLGPLALPLLWGSRRFTLAWKVILTVLVIAETAFIVRGAWVAVQQSLAPLRELGL